MSSLYFQVDLATMSVVADAEPLPERLAGLNDESLRDLTPLADQVPEYRGHGFWPRHEHQCAQVGARTLVLDSELGVVVDKLPCVDPPALAYDALRRDTPYPDGYGSVSEQLDLLFHAGFAGWADHVAAVKRRYPKPDAK